MCHSDPRTERPANPVDDRAAELAGYYALTQRAFGRLARWYDAIALLVARLRPRVVTFAAVPAGARVLDVATGTGAQALAFAGRGYEVVGIDLVEEMLDVARHKRHAKRVTFQRMDATQLTFPPQSFDASTVSFGLHDMPASVRGLVLREMVRVTRTGGTVVIVDYGLPANAAWRWLAMRVIRTWEGDWYDEFVTSDVTALLESAGLAIQARETSWLGAVQLIRATTPR